MPDRLSSIVLYMSGTKSTVRGILESVACRFGVTILQQEPLMVCGGTWFHRHKAVNWCKLRLNYALGGPILPRRIEQQ